MHFSQSPFLTKFLDCIFPIRKRIRRLYTFSYFLSAETSSLYLFSSTCAIATADAAMKLLVLFPSSLVFHAEQVLLCAIYSICEAHRRFVFSDVL